MSAICWEESLTKGENYWRKCFWTKEGETRCKFKPRLALISIWTWNGPLRSTCRGQRLNWYDIAGCDNNIVQMIASLGGEIDALTLSSLSVPNVKELGLIFLPLLHPNSEVQKLPSRLCFPLLSIIIMITSNKS